MREVRVVSDSERFWRWVYRPRNILIMGVVGAAFVLVSEFGGIVGGFLIVAVVAAVVGLWYWVNVNRFTTGVTQHYAAWSDVLRRTEISQREALVECVGDIQDLAKAGLTDEDIKRDVLLGEKYPRPVALAALELAVLPYPELPALLKFRAAQLEAPILKSFDEEVQAIKDETAEGLSAETTSQGENPAKSPKSISE